MACDSREGARKAGQVQWQRQQHVGHALCMRPAHSPLEHQHDAWRGGGEAAGCWRKGLPWLHLTHVGSISRGAVRQGQCLLYSLGCSKPRTPPHPAGALLLPEVLNPSMSEPASQRSPVACTARALSGRAGAGAGVTTACGRNTSMHGRRQAQLVAKSSCSKCGCSWRADSCWQVSRVGAGCCDMSYRGELLAPLLLHPSSQ
jgi:hypothetical protein